MPRHILILPVFRCSVGRGLAEIEGDIRSWARRGLFLWFQFGCCCSRIRQLATVFPSRPADSCNMPGDIAQGWRWPFPFVRL